MFISALEAEKGLEDPAMMVFVAEESKPGTGEETQTHEFKLVSSGLKDDSNCNY
jgi:hypothetical protein